MFNNIPRVVGFCMYVLYLVIIIIIAFSYYYYYI